MTPSPEPFIMLDTADGVQLEATIARPPDNVEVVAGVVACHPHPRYGGDLHNVAPATLAATLPDRGVTVLRFNFRGTGRSGGSHGDGSSERLDVVAAVEWLAAQLPGLPVVIAGYSFGADVALDVTHPAVSGWFAIAPPLQVFAEFTAATDARPKALLVPAFDQFRSPEAAANATASWINCSVVPLESCDHFLAGASTRIAQAAWDFVEAVRTANA